MSLHADLLTQARHLAQVDPGRPKRANLRRAVSSAYYALFHFLIDQSVRNLMGTGQSLAAYRRVLSRGFDHGTMKNACVSFAGSQLPKAVAQGLPQNFAIPTDLRRVAQAFFELQERRHNADYNLVYDFNKADVLTSVQQAEQAIDQFERIQDRTAKRFFVVCLLTWKSLSGR